MDFDLFTPSYLNAFEEYFLSFNVLSLCERCYLEKDDNAKNDFMLSTIKTPLEILKEYPETNMLVCELDPLLDDGLRFAERFLWFNKKS